MYEPVWYFLPTYRVISSVVLWKPSRACLEAVQSYINDLRLVSLPSNLFFLFGLSFHRLRSPLLRLRLRGLFLRSEFLGGLGFFVIGEPSVLGFSSPIVSSESEVVFSFLNCLAICLFRVEIKLIRMLDKQSFWQNPSGTHTQRWICLLGRLV